MLYELNDLDKLIDIKKRDRFIKRIFGGNSDDYLDFITRIEDIENWKDAYRFMDDELARRNININDHQDAVNLTDIIFKKFFPLYHF